MSNIFCALAFSAVLAAGGWLRFRAAAADYQRSPAGGDEPQYYDMGLSILREAQIKSYGFPTAFRNALYPSFIALTGFLWRPPEPGKIRVAQAGISTLCIALIFCCGLIAHSRLCGIVAAGLLAFNAGQIAAVTRIDVSVFFSYLLCLVLCALLLWSARPGTHETIFLGISGGLSLACRSTLFLFPFFLLPLSPGPGRRRENYGAGKRAVPESRLITAKNNFLLSPVKTSAVLLACFYLPLLPWTARNYLRFGEFSPFERHAAIVNIFTASLGTVRTLGNISAEETAASLNYGFEEAKEPERCKIMARMAMANVARHPARYFASCARRFYALCLWIPEHLAVRSEKRPAASSLLIFFLLPGLALGFRNPQMRALSAFLLYFLIVLSTMSVESDYLIPSVPAMLVLAAWGIVSAGRAAIYMLSKIAGKKLRAWARLLYPEWEKPREEIPAGLRNPAFFCAAAAAPALAYFISLLAVAGDVLIPWFR